MSRRSRAEKRKILPDPVYGSEMLAKFINITMRSGKKSIAEAIVYDALSLMVQHVENKQAGGAAKKSDKKSKDQSMVAHPKALDTLKKTLNNVRPTVELKPRRVGGATYQVPVEVSVDRGEELAMRWLISAARGRNEKTMVLRLAAEFEDAYHGRGAAVKTRDDMHRMAQANQAFAHYRW